MCGQENPLSLGLQFRPINDDVVQAEFRPHPILQGYDGIVHGGIVAALLDAAMTHCLFHRGIRALTGDLHVRYRKSIPIDTMLNLQARIVLIKQPLYRLRAEISQNGCIFAWAEAKFMRRP
jgi:uncharacterized protein (TIGR00369 family)